MNLLKSGPKASKVSWFHWKKFSYRVNTSVAADFGELVQIHISDIPRYTVCTSSSFDLKLYQNLALNPTKTKTFID